MHHALKLTLLAACINAAFSTAAHANTTHSTHSTSPALVLKRVSLSSSGVGYFEYEAQVRGNAVLSLPVALDKVDDVLKSLVVYDSVGSIAGVSLPGQDPIAQTLKQLPFDSSALTQPTALLQALRGAVVSVASGKNHRAMTGRIVSVQAIAATEQLQAKHHVMLLTDSGMQQFVLEEAQNLQFEEPALRDQLARALAALSSNRAKDGRTVEISSQSSSQAPRTVRVGYVTTVPIWKNAYRVTMPTAAAPATGAAAALKAQVQSWAVVENLSGQDWAGVELTLTAGKPVAFSQQLYRSYFNQRTELGVELPGNIVPQADQGAQRVAAGADRPIAASAAPSRAYSAPSPAAAPMAIRPTAERSSNLAGAKTAPLYALASSAVSAPKNKEAPLSTATPLDLPDVTDDSAHMSYTFGMPVTVGSGRSLSIPIIQANLPMQRVALYQPNVGGRHPLAALELDNTLEYGLPAGAATLYEAGARGSQFLGDAQLSALPAQDKRYMAYALDQKITMAHDTQNHSQLLGYSRLGAVVMGRYLHTAYTQFTVKSAHAEPRDTVVEVQKSGGAYALNPSKNGDYALVSSTPEAYRINIVAKPKATVSVQIPQSYEGSQVQFNLNQISAAALRPYIDSPALDPANKPALERVWTLRLEAERATQAWNAANTALQQARNEQSRIRQALAELPARFAGQSSLVADLKAADATESLANAQGKKVLEQRHAAEKALADYVASL